jgi:succinate-acetate transporter protein
MSDVFLTGHTLAIFSSFGAGLLSFYKFVITTRTQRKYTQRAQRTNNFVGFVLTFVSFVV